jgi:predicted ester cyclase
MRVVFLIVAENGCLPLLSHPSFLTKSLLVSLFGLPPTGKQATFTGLVISRMAGGQIAEEWEHFDQLGLLQQLGAVPRI